MLKHLLLQVVRFLFIMGIPTVMMKTIMKPAFLMEEIVVDLMSRHNTAQNANALEEEEEEGAVEELQHLRELQLL